MILNTHYWNILFRTYNSNKLYTFTQPGVVECTVDALEVEFRSSMSSMPIGVIAPCEMVDCAAACNPGPNWDLLTNRDSVSE